MGKYVGTLVAESLRDQGLINDFAVIENTVSQAGEWHLYKVKVTQEEIGAISKNLVDGTWYAHFWKGDDVIVAFKDKIFEFKHSDKESRQPAIMYGLSLGIPKEQLDFPIE